MILEEVGDFKRVTRLQSDCMQKVNVSHVTHPVSDRVAVLAGGPLLATKHIWPHLPSPELLHCGPLIYQRAFGLELR